MKLRFVRSVAGLLALTIFTMCLSWLTDPGFIPRHEQPHPTAKDQRKTHTLADGRKSNTIYRWIQTEVGVDPFTWCTTCKLWRPPFAHHCSDCGHCVLGFDHHCPFINNCVGVRNHLYFLWFVAFAAALAVTTLGACISTVVLLTEVRHGPIASRSVGHGPIASRSVGLTTLMVRLQKSGGDFGEPRIIGLLVTSVPIFVLAGLLVAFFIFHL